MNPLTPLQNTASLEKLAYEKIKQAILTFGFLPNQALVEADLAAQLGISKTPVRDALMQLEKEGLVTRVPFKGTYVADINNHDMAEIFAIRMVLEGLAIRLATTRLTEDDFEHLEALIEQHAAALERQDVTQAARLNSEYHSLIISRCGNERLIKMLSLLDDQLKRYRLLSIAQGLRTEKSVPEHRDILDALRARNAVRAEAAMKEHLQSAMSDLYNQDFKELEQLVLRSIKS